MRPFYQSRIEFKLSKKTSKIRIWLNKTKIIVSLIALIIVCTFCVMNAQKSTNLVSGLGILAFLGFAWIFSSHRSHIQWGQVLWGLLLQFALANFVLKTQVGQSIFVCLGEKITIFLQSSRAGTEFVFGHLVTDGLKDSKLIIFAFTVIISISF